MTLEQADEPADAHNAYVPVSTPEGAPIGAVENVLGAISADDLTRLATALADYRQLRMAADDDWSVAIPRAVGVTLIAGPSELGLEAPSTPARDWARSILNGIRPDDVPETRVCHLWLSCASGERGADAADEFVALASETLWEPVQALVYRALAFYGRRTAIANALPKSGLLSLAQADAWLEAAHVDDNDDHWTERISPMSSLLPQAVREAWTRLLKAERTLAFRSDSEPVTSDLVALASLANQNPPRTLAESESRRIAVRAASALARARLAQRIEVESVMAGILGSALPAWERAYLRGLGSWQDGDISGAASRLQSALERNPHQTSIRLAVASLKASQSPEEALAVLEHPEPTREMWSARAALLARLERYAEAEDALQHCTPQLSVTNEPARYSWSRGRTQSRRREAALRTALAERRRDWEMASKSWQAVSASRRTLQEIRQLFAARQELESLPAGKSWRRDVLQQRLGRGRHELGSIPLVGDALFFRAMAMQDVLPDRSVKDFETLLRRRAWVEAECRVGGGRIIYAADALLRAGRVDDAVRAYELVWAARAASVDDRLAVALVLKEILRHAEASAITREAERATALAPTSPWPQLLAALGLLIVGDVSSARSRLDVAETRGAPAVVCRCLRSTCAAASSGAATLTDEELNTLPGEVGAVVRFLCGSETLVARIKTFADKFGEDWLAHCPTDPHLAARRFLAILCDEGKWEEAMRFADSLARSKQPWAKELAVLARVRHALQRACRGELDEAESELTGLASCC